MGTSLQQLEKKWKVKTGIWCLLFAITSYKLKFVPVKGQLWGLRLGRLVPFES